jgi:hypothetical protein
VVSDDAGKIVNFIKSRPLNSLISLQLCYEMDSSHTRRFNGCYYAEFLFIYSCCNRKCCYSVLTIPSSYNHVCVRLAYYENSFIKINEISASCANMDLLHLLLFSSAQFWYKYTTHLHALHVLAYCGHHQTYRVLKSPFFLSAVPPYTGQSSHIGSAL